MRKRATLFCVALIALTVDPITDLASQAPDIQKGPCGESIDRSPPPPGWERIGIVKSDHVTHRAGPRVCEWKVDLVEYRETRTNGFVSLHRRYEYTLITATARDGSRTMLEAEASDDSLDVVTPDPPAPLAGMAQTTLDFVRGAIDGLTFGVTRELRNRLYRDAGAILDEQAAEIGQNTGLVASVLLPVPGPGKVKAAVNLAEFAESTNITMTVAKAVQAASNRVWQLPPFMRGKVIENALAALEYRAKGFDWIGVADKGRFRQIDFINAAQRELVSLKTVFRTSEQGWAQSVNSLRRHMVDLADVNKQWTFWKAGSAPTKTILDVRVPPGYEAMMSDLTRDLAAYGRSLGVELRIGTF